MDLVEKKFSRIQELIEKITGYDQAYYIHNKSLISDYEYDLLFKELQQLEKEVNFVSENSPTKKLTKLQSTFNRVKHIKKMFSMDNTYNVDELINWIHKQPKKFDYVIEPKIDGLSLNLIYKNGILTQAITRGDGEYGEDVTMNAFQINSIPVKIDMPKDSFIEIRGEVFIDNNEFDKINRELEEQKQPTFNSARNLASGSLRCKDVNITKQRNLTFVPHTLGACQGIVLNTQVEFLNWCMERKFRNSAYIKFNNELYVDLIENIKKFINNFNKNNFYAPVDGLVIKVNDFNECKQLGETARVPRYVVAYKFPAETKLTRIENIKLQVSRTGTITPVAVIRPIILNGATITNVTLHNFDEIKRLNINIGDEVEVIRSGEVIPKIIRVNAKFNNEPYKVPEVCPDCGTKLIKDGDVALVCPNENCYSKKINQLVHWAKKDALNIEDLSEKTAKKIIDNFGKNNKDIIDILYNLSYEDILSLDEFQEKSTKNLYNAIQESKNRPLYKILYGLNIPGVGLQIAKLLSENCSDLMDLYNRLVMPRYPKLPNIEGIGLKTYTDIKRWFVDHLDLIYKLYKYEFTAKSDRFNLRKSNLFINKTFVITGTLSKPRKEIQAQIEYLSGKVSSSISSNTTYLLCGENAGTKLEKAKQLGVKIITEQEFNKMISGLF